MSWSKNAVILAGLAQVALGTPFNVSSTQDTPVPPRNNVAVTHYNGKWGGGNCGFTTYKPTSGMPGAAITGKMWYNGGYCGACVNVRERQGGRQVTAMIMDQSPGLPQDLNLFEEAYQYLAPRTQQSVQADWDIVSCQNAEALALDFMEGSSAWWLSTRVINSNYPINAVWMRSAGNGQWNKLSNKDWNAFTWEKPLGETVDVRVECVNGQAVMMENVRIAAKSIVMSGGNC
ncbi:hypothetical protein BT63DRAFT_423185 [Microthyrium microscopicum]|uniref:Expansin-like EG45 domain-containing protein n=1 Tax=Microthyrium microscopicum TaxID=703497 RepID=A0A6A6UHK3_9PEZI|nr:hypothetical protein BT63DRAFT_423185 [Microthyrium microscopicum]